LHIRRGWNRKPPEDLSIRHTDRKPDLKNSSITDIGATITDPKDTDIQSIKK